MNSKKDQRIIHRPVADEKVHKTVDNVHKSLTQKVLSDIYYVSGAHSYQQIAGY